jgi:hypothetical protein
MNDEARKRYKVGIGAAAISALIESGVMLSFRNGDQGLGLR